MVWGFSYCCCYGNAAGYTARVSVSDETQLSRLADNLFQVCKRHKRRQVCKDIKKDRHALFSILHSFPDTLFISFISDTASQFDKKKKMSMCGQCSRCFSLMRPVRRMSWQLKFNGSQCGLPPSFTHRMTGLEGKGATGGGGGGGNWRGGRQLRLN